jgi:hypothetical protein
MSIDSRLFSLPSKRRNAALGVRCKLAVLALLSLNCLDATALKPETLNAWETYLAAATAAMQARLQPGAKFLWLDEETGRREP